MEITRGNTQPEPLLGEPRERWQNQKISLKITRCQRNKRRGLKARDGRKRKNRDHKNLNTPSEHPNKRRRISKCL